jgi:hypothetical protein
MFGQDPSGEKYVIKCTTKQLTWMVYFLKLYNQEEVNAINVGVVYEKTFWKRTWLFIEVDSYLE